MMATAMDEAEAPATLPALLAQQVRARGTHPALVTAQEAISYQKLDRLTARMARALLAAGAGKGTRIGLLAPDGVFFVVAFMSALRIGALVTTVSTLSTPPELAFILRHSDVQFLIATRHFLNHDYAFTLEQALPGLNAGTAPHHLQAAPYLRSIWLDDAVGCDWAQPVEALLAQADAQGAPDAALLAAIEQEVTPGDDAIIVYTSGSTGTPKAVVHRHWALARHSPELARHFLLRRDDRLLTILPGFWLAGMSMLLQVLSIGATLVYPATPDTDAILDAIERFNVNRVNAWGDRLPKLIEAAAARGIDVSRIPDLSHFCDEAGNSLPSKISMYGMTESFSAHSAERLDAALPPGKEKSFGRAINGYERRVVAPETGQQVAPGEAGELQIRGPALMTGFYKNRREEVFTADGFYPTRDLVRIDADGYLYPEGRRDDMIKTRGANVSRLEVEAALAALPGVAFAVVAGLPDAAYERIVVAAVVPSEAEAPTEDGLKAALRSVLSSFKIPRRIVFITEGDIPRTATGKIKIAEAAAMINARIR
jgi:acyl-CoA synthetase (AMP-forming)/AMP-acid ligase II